MFERFDPPVIPNPGPDDLAAAKSRWARRRRRAVIAVSGSTAVVVLVLAALLAPSFGVGDHEQHVASTGGTSATTTTEAAPSTTEALTTSTTVRPTPVGPSPTALPPTTAVKTFNPWTAGGALGPGIKVLGSLSGGSCIQHLGYTNVYGQSDVPWASIAASSNKNAWRCNTDQGIHDACFAPPGGTNITKLACATSPSSGVYLLALSEPLPTSSTGFTPNGVWPFEMVLPNGDHCSVIQGTAPVFGQTGLNYDCETGNASPPATASPRWTVKFLPRGGHALTTMTVTMVWI